MSQQLGFKTSLLGIFFFFLLYLRLTAVFAFVGQRFSLSHQRDMTSGLHSDSLLGTQIILLKHQSMFSQVFAWISAFR